MMRIRRPASQVLLRLLTLASWAPLGPVAAGGEARAVGNLWGQLSVWGPCSALDGCQWHSPLSRKSTGAAAPYIRRVSLFAATGGCAAGYPGCTFDRDLLSDPRNASSAVDATPLLAQMAVLLHARLHVRVVTGGVPIALSANAPVIGGFGFNTALPASMPAYMAYITEIARQIVARFGLEMVRRSVSFGCFTEANNRQWLNATAAEYASLYDATVCGLRTAIPAKDLVVGAHLTVDYGHWDAASFIQHAMNGSCACCAHLATENSGGGDAATGVQLDFLGVSFYEAAAGVPGDLSAFDRIALGLRQRAIAAGFGAAAGERALEFGVEEGRILAGPDGLQLGTHALGDDYQVSWDGLLFIKALKAGLKYVARWGVNSQMSGPFGLQGMSATGANARLDNGAASLARLCLRMSADRLLANSTATVTALQATAGSGSGGSSIVDAVASTNCTGGAAAAAGLQSIETPCVLRVFLVNHFTALDAGAARCNVSTTATVCGIDGALTGWSDRGTTVTKVGGGAAVWWREWWKDAKQANLSVAAGDYLPGLSPWGDEPPLASARAKQVWAAGLPKYRQKAVLQTQALDGACAIVGGGCVRCMLSMPAHSAALLELRMDHP
jgi:hypothetical protein